MKQQITLPLNDATRILAMSVAREQFPELVGRRLKANTTLVKGDDGLVSDIHIEFEELETAAD